VTRAEIEEELYGFEDDIASNAIEVHIHNLRRKLGPRFITNLKGPAIASRPPLAPSDPVAAPAHGDRRVGAACLVFMILGLLVYRAVATSTARQFDELLQQQAELALPMPITNTARARPSYPHRSATAASSAVRRRLQIARARISCCTDPRGAACHARAATSATHTVLEAAPGGCTH